MRAGPLNDQMREALEEARTKMGLEKEHADKVIAGLATQQASSAVAVRSRWVQLLLSVILHITCTLPCMHFGCTHAV